jgi:hypothetical protein
LALRVGYIGPWPEALGLGWNCLGATLDGSGLDLGVDGLGCLRGYGVRGAGCGAGDLIVLGCGAECGLNDGRGS